MGKEEAEFPKQTKFLLICINRCYVNQGLDIAVRYSWKLNPAKAAEADLVLAIFHGEIVGVYEANKWLAATKEDFSPGIPAEHGNWNKQKGRFGFHGREAPKEITMRYVGKHIPLELKFNGNPIRYANF